MISLSKRGNSYNKILLRIDGLSSETKPAQFVNEFDNDNRLIKSFYIPNGSSFVEIDTGKEFLYDEENAEWYEFNGDSSGSEYAHSLELAINSQTYVLTATLKNTDGDTLGTPQTIDLPLESMVVGGSYDDNTKKVILTLKNGNTVDFSVADLVDGLQSEITSANKLNSDLVDDTNQNNKFVTSAEKTKIANAITVEQYNAGKTIPNGITYTIDGTTYTVGINAELFNDYSHNKAIGHYSHSEGAYTTALGVCSHAEGNSTVAKGAYSHSEGGNTNAEGYNSHAEGGNTTASGSCSHAEGYNNNASGDNAHAEGASTTASGNNSHTEGLGTVAGSAYQHTQGKYNVNDQQSKYAFIIGNGTDSNSRSNAFAVDWNGLIYVNNAATGVDVSQLQPVISSSNKLSADYVDDSNTSNKFVTSAEKTKIANALTQETYNAGKTVAKGTTFVLDNVTYTVGDNAETFNNYASNKVAGNYSHAEGNQTKATGGASHAEGGYTKASGTFSHAEGGNTTASGDRSHAEGNFTTASGTRSHAEGGNTIASGTSSHAEGSYTIAASYSQHVQGKYNVEDSSDKYSFIIGNGTSINARSNAFAVDWDGKIYVNNAVTGVDVSTLQSTVTDIQTTIGNINAVLEEVL